MKTEFDLNYEPFEYKSAGSFSDQVRKELLLSKDEAYQALLKKKQEDLKKQEDDAKKLSVLEEIKDIVIDAAKKGQREVWVNMNNRKDYWNENNNNELSNDLDGLKAEWENHSGSCGNHGYNSYSDDYYHIQW